MFWLWPFTWTHSWRKPPPPWAAALPPAALATRPSHWDPAGTTSRRKCWTPVVSTNNAARRPTKQPMWRQVSDLAPGWNSSVGFDHRAICRLGRRLCLLLEARSFAASGFIAQAMEFEGFGNRFVNSCGGFYHLSISNLAPSKQHCFCMPRSHFPLSCGFDESPIWNHQSLHFLAYHWAECLGCETDLPPTCCTNAFWHQTDFGLLKITDFAGSLDSSHKWPKASEREVVHRRAVYSKHITHRRVSAKVSCLFRHVVTHFTLEVPHKYQTLMLKTPGFNKFPSVLAHSPSKFQPPRGFKAKMDCNPISFSGSKPWWTWNLKKKKKNIF